MEVSSHLRFGIRSLAAAILLVAVFLSGWAAHRRWSRAQFQRAQKSQRIEVERLDGVVVIRGPKPQVDLIADIVEDIEHLPQNADQGKFAP